MCTAISYLSRHHYFGRNLDLEHTYEENVVITPRGYPLPFRYAPMGQNHYALIGMATIIEDYPLYYEATNEKGLSVAALNFPDNASYFPFDCEKNNVAPFELIPWLLMQCSNITQAEKMIAQMNIINQPFSADLPLTPLHWIVSDRNSCIVIESTRDGMICYNNPICVLTNNPPFPYHLYNLSNYMNLMSNEPINRFSNALPLDKYSRGMGAIGLPGDMSSASRFIRAAFHLHNSISEGTAESDICQFFHILDSVAMIRGSVRLNEELEITQYSSCCNTDKGIYYYTTYKNRQITAIDMHKSDLNGSSLIRYPLINKQHLKML